MKVVLADTYGFCMGAKRAIEIAKKVRKENDGEVSVLKQIVHNPYVVDSLKKIGIDSIDSLEKIKKGTVIFSAHGVGPDIVEEARKKGLDVIDATCPLVMKVHSLVKELAKKGYRIILVGDKNHDEIVGVVGEALKNIKLIEKEEEVGSLDIDSSKMAVITQTTSSVDDYMEILNVLKKKFPNIEVYNTICNATQLRQKAVKDLARKVDVVLVVGSKTSANSNRLVEVARSCGKPAFLVDSKKEIKKDWFDGVKTVGITSGASTPDEVLKNVVEKVRLL